MDKQQTNEGAAHGTAPPDGETPASDEWLTMARDAYTESTDWFDASIRTTIEKSMAHFANRHAPGSKYLGDSYKFRSRSFRPKTRSTIRRNEAAAATAFFSTQDMVSCLAENEADPKQQMSAKILAELLNYRLDDSIPWFQILIGAYQNALNVGCAISHQCWDYDEYVTDEQLDDGAGNGMLYPDGDPITREVRHVITDKPRIDLVAIENFRLSPASDWTDPCGSSPYIVEMIPMFIGDVREKMRNGEWFEFSDGEIQAAAQTQYDSIRAERDGPKKQDAADVSHSTAAFDTAWIHRNIVRKDGEDYIFYTLGTHQRLSEPKPLREVYRHLARGERPYVMGHCIIETHKAYKAGLNELTFGLQEETNEIQNQRRDNVTLVMNKRYFAKRTATIDYKSLTRNVPGSVTLVDDINQDIRWDSPPDVTSSSYQEHDRVSLDYDEMAGAFSPGSVQSNRKLGDTVGGMEMLSSDANIITEYQLRVFAETWVERVLKQLVKLEQEYETDELVMLIAGQKAQYFEKMGVDKITDDALQGSMKVRVNVGFGSTNPQKRVEKLQVGLGAIATFLPQALQELDTKEVVTEIMGALGFKGAERFFPKLGKEAKEDPKVAELTQALQAAQQELERRTGAATVTANSRVQIEAMKTELRREELDAEAELEYQRMQFEAEENERDRQNDLAIAVIDERMKSTELTSAERQTLDKIKSSLAQTSMKLNTTRELAKGGGGQSPGTGGPPRAPKPVPTPAVIEPPQQAPAGEAFQQ